MIVFTLLFLATKGFMKVFKAFNLQNSPLCFLLCKAHDQVNFRVLDRFVAWLILTNFVFNPLMPGGTKKVTHT